MLATLLAILATALSLLVVDTIFSGIDITNFTSALVAGVSIGLVNSGIKPIVLLLSLPLNILSLGTFSLVINGLCFWLASLFVPGFNVSGVFAFIFAPVILSIVNSFLNRYFTEKFSVES